MALFRKRRKDDQTDDQVIDSTEADSPDVEETPQTGPFDSSEIDNRGARIDLGSLWLPGVDGMKLRFEVDQKTQQAIGVSLGVGNSVLQINVFAAPRSEGIWDEVREELSASIEQQGGNTDEVDGPFGRELRARMAVVQKGGQSGLRPVRFIGVDGPRWFLRAVITGEAVVRPASAPILEHVLSQLVVIRDSEPRAPREPLPLSLPRPGDGIAPKPGDSGDKPDEAELELPKRGPEITEVH